MVKIPYMDPLGTLEQENTQVFFRRTHQRNSRKPDLSFSDHHEGLSSIAVCFLHSAYFVQDIGMGRCRNLPLLHT